MDLEVTDDEMSDYDSGPSNSLDAADSEEGFSEDCEYRDHVYFKGVIVRVPLSFMRILAATAATVAPYVPYNCCRVSKAWMRAISKKFPVTPLGAIRAKDPSLVPRWLLDKEDAKYWTVLRPGGIYARRDSPPPSRWRDPDPKSILAAALQCRFREGFASEGMLCNDPPIPLRVLDFLEHAEDLLNHALVCKATHQAGHVLLQREFRSELRSGLSASAMLRRKESMLKSAMRQPIQNNTAATSAPPLKTGTETCTGGADAADHLCEFLAEWPEHDCMEHPMFTILRAAQSPEPGATTAPPLVNQVDPVLPGGLLSWRQYLVNSKRFPVVMDGEAVTRAAAMLEDFDVGTPDATDSAQRCAREVLRILHAAQREGQGLLLLGEFYNEFEHERMESLWA